MPTSYQRTLEDLRLAPEPAWLWDGARGRIVWANAAGVALFDGRTVFDLVDRPFDRREAGVQRIAELVLSLEPGQTEKALLHFPSAGQALPLSCWCSLHLLADGRPGVLVIAEPPKARPTPVPENLAQLAVNQLPLALLFADSTGRLLHCNDQAAALVKIGEVENLREIIVPPARADSLLARLKEATLASSVETIDSPLGLRDARLTLSRLSSGNGAMLTVLMEDITDRRALERGLETSPPPEAAPRFDLTASPAQAFEILAKSMKDAIRQPLPETAKVVAQPEKARSEKKEASEPAQIPVQAAVQASVPAPSPAPEKKPEANKISAFVPQPVRDAFERSGAAVLIGRGEDPLFATEKAAALMGYATSAQLLADRALWQQVKSAAQASFLSLPLPGGRAVDLAVISSTVPWHNGPAEQFILTPEEPRQRPQPTEAAAPKPILPPPPSPAVAPPPALSPALSPAPSAIPRRDAREAIDAAELKALLDVASDGIIALDAEGLILSFSAGAEAIFGVSQAEAINRPLADLLSPESRKALRDYLAALHGPGLASVFNDGREVTAIMKSGGTLPLFLTVGRLLSPHSKATFCAVVRDITQWKRTERELREAKDSAELASRQKSDFLARISHEIRTPLNAILGFSEVMRLERFGEIKNDKYRGYATDIHASGSHLLSLVNDLLDLAKVESGKLELDFTAVSLHDVTENAMKLLQDEAARHHVVVRKSFAANIPRVVADNRALRQVMLNLLSNGIKYTDAGGQVIVSAQPEANGEIVLRVRDTGIGMTPSQLQDALQPFQRVEMPERERQGTGLGLPLTKALVEANRAQFTISSEAGKGTLVEIRFPAQRVLAE